MPWVSKPGCALLCAFNRLIRFTSGMTLVPQPGQDGGVYPGQIQMGRYSSQVSMGIPQPGMGTPHPGMGYPLARSGQGEGRGRGYPFPEMGYPSRNGVPPDQVRIGGGIPARDGVPLSRDRVPPVKRWGTPHPEVGHPPDLKAYGVLDMWQAVCLLCSCRWTFLFTWVTSYFYKGGQCEYFINVNILLMSWNFLWKVAMLAPVFLYSSVIKLF